jgi:TP901 family phage tail tape measure protein
VADVNANIGVNIDASNALAQIKALQRQLSQFHTSVAKSSSAAAAAQASFQKNLINSINATGAFSAELRTVKTTSEAFTNALEKNKFSMREYFRYAGASTKTFGSLFKSEFDTISKVAEDRVKKLQTQYIKLGRDSSGAMKAIAVIPNQLDLDNHSTKVQLAAQKQAIFNQLLKQGSTNLLNFGKNTQWAGRQLMVGFTLPLATLGMTASKAFMDMETAALKFRKVYGDLLTPKEETEQALENIKELAKEFTQYGVAVSKTVSLAAEAAAAGFQGLDLQRQTIQATRLSILGQIETQQALDTTIALQNAFKMSSEDLADSINFLNAVENQTVVSLDDITIAIPKVAPVIQQLGGDVKDLAFFMTAMKQGGINASEGANALKSGLASLINPTNTASKMLAGMGININNIVESNQGDLKSTVIDFALALDKLDPLNRARAIEQMFGKFQFARLSALFSNVIADGTQASRVLDLAGASIEELSALSESELGMSAESSMNKFRKAVEDLKLALVPVGETFLKSVTPILEFFGGILEKFGSLSENTKKIITILTVAIAGIGPVVLMTFGLLANGIANIIKLFAILRNGYLRLSGQSTVLGEQTQYMTSEQLEAAAAAHSLNQSHANLTQTFTAESGAVRSLIAAYTDGTIAASKFAMANPGMMLPGRGKVAKKFAQGGMISGPGGPTSDSVPVMASNGEAIISAATVKKYPGIVAGLIAGNIPGFKKTGIVGEAAKERMNPFFTQDRRRKIADEFNLGEDEKLRIPLTSGASAYSVAGILAPRDVNRKTALGMTQEYAQSPIGRAAQMANIQVELEDLGLSATRVSEVLDSVGPTIQTAVDEFDGSVESWTKSAGKASETINKMPSLTGPEKIAIRKRVAPINPEDYTVGSSPMVEVSRKKVRTRNERNTAAYRAERQAKILRDQGYDVSGFDYSHMPGFEKIPASLSKVADPSIKGRNLTDIEKQRANSVRQEYETAKKVGKSYSKGIEETTKDPYMLSRDRKSPHPLAAKDGKDDAKAYSQASQKELKKRRRVSRRPQGAAPIGPSAPAGATMLPIVSQPTQRDLRRTAIRDRARSVGGRVAGSMRGGRGMGISSGAMIASQFLPGKAGQIAGQASGIAFAAQSLMMLPGPLKLVAAGAMLSVGAYKLFAAASERARLKIDGLAEAASTSKKQLETLGSFFGVTPRKLSREDRKEGSLAAPVGATQRSAVDSLRALEDFQKDYKNTISSLKTATNDDAKMIFNSLAVELKGRGFASSNIQTIIQALQEEAGKTDLNINFKNIGVATEKNLEKQAKVVSAKIRKIISTAERPDNPSFTNESLGGVSIDFTPEQEARVKAAAASLASLYDGLIGQFEGGEISLEDYTKRLNILTSSVSGMNEETRKIVLSQMINRLDPAAKKAAEKINNLNTQLKVTVALLMGTVTADTPLVKALAKVTDPKVVRELLKGLDERTAKQTARYAKATQDAIDALEGDATGLGDALKKAFSLKDFLTKGTKEINTQIKAFNLLRKAGFDAAFAMDIAGNADVAAAIKANGLTKANIQLLKTYKARQEALKKLQEEESKRAEEASKTFADREKERLDIQLARFNLEEAIIKSQYTKNLEDINEKLRNQKYELELVNRQLEEQDKNLASIVDPKEGRIDDIQYILEGISFQEAAINEKYDEQSKLLSTITKMNQNLYSIQQKRISLADALSSGDISAAAALVTEMRAEEASIQASSQQEALDLARERELNGLGRIALEKESKRLQYEILTIQRNQSTALEDQAESIQKIVDNLTNEISDIEEKAADQIAASSKRLSDSFKMTKGQIESAMSMLDLANSAGLVDSPSLITNILDAAIGKAEALKAIMSAIPSLSSGQTTKDNVVMDPLWKSVVVSVAEANKAAADKAVAQAAADKALSEKAAANNVVLDPLYRATVADTSNKTSSPYKITDPIVARLLGMSSGGMVPKYMPMGGLVPYMSNGGLFKPKGTDTVPAMLTPGEFVVNAKSAQAAGPLLAQINSPSFSGFEATRFGASKAPTQNSASVYNYTVGINVNQSNSSPDDIARAVMGQIKYMDSQRIRGQR